MRMSVLRMEFELARCESFILHEILDYRDSAAFTDSFPTLTASPLQVSFIHAGKGKLRPFGELH
jgi:hypothetical protein